ncbi:PH domain-containing protein [Candidatus Daviesbacteria bacterium]|nr:PH domain-containing protein [Candidatus Daviesbacteria bacterium]
MGKPKFKDPPAESDKKNFAKYLAEDEELVLVTGYSKIYLRQKFIIFILIPGALFILAGLGLAYFLKYNLGQGLLFGMLFSIIVAYLTTLLTFHSHRYLLTTRRVMIKEGFFKVNLSSALYDKITHIEVKQSFYDRLIMHHGTVIINTAGMNKVEMKLEYVDSPIEFKNLLERLITREREVFSRNYGNLGQAVEGELVED